jgi:uncharacterized protein YidB (DUF937 family)
MSGLDDLIGSLTKKSGSGDGGSAGIEDLLGGLLGGGGSTGGSGSGGGLGDVLGGILGGDSAGASGGGGVGTKSGVNTGALVGALAPLIIGMLKSGGLQKLIQGFQQKGMGAQADSWVSTGGNAPVSGGDMKVGLGEDEVRHFAQEAGIPEDEAADVLAAVVPQVVNRLTPNGQVPTDAELESLLRQVQPAQT